MLSTYEVQSRWLAGQPRLQGKSLMEHLHGRLDGLYPGRWKQAFSDHAAIENWEYAWSEAFDEEGLTPNDVAMGLKNCRRMYTWPPSLSEFLQACRPHLKPETAFYEALRGLTARSKGDDFVWSHPAIYYAAVHIGQRDMLAGSFPPMAERWTDVLAQALAKGQWEPIPAPVVQLPAPKRTEEGNRAASAALKKMGADSVLRVVNPSKKWAEKILAKKDKPSLAVIRMAQAALGIEV